MMVFLLRLLLLVSQVHRDVSQKRMSLWHACVSRRRPQRKCEDFLECTPHARYMRMISYLAREQLSVVAAQVPGLEAASLPASVLLPRPWPPAQNVLYPQCGVHVVVPLVQLVLAELACPLQVRRELLVLPLAQQVLQLLPVRRL